MRHPNCFAGRFTAAHSDLIRHHESRLGTIGLDVARVAASISALGDVSSLCLRSCGIRCTPCLLSAGQAALLASSFLIAVVGVGGQLHYLILLGRVPSAK
jgi:hypothetical protein